MSIVSLIRGENPPVTLANLTALAKQVSQAVRSGRIVEIKLADSERKILRSILFGLEIPYTDQGVNGFFVCYDQDILDKWLYY